MVISYKIKMFDFAQIGLLQTGIKQNVISHTTVFFIGVTKICCFLGFCGLAAVTFIILVHLVQQFKANLIERHCHGHRCIQIKQLGRQTASTNIRGRMGCSLELSSSMVL